MEVISDILILVVLVLPMLLLFPDALQLILVTFRMSAALLGSPWP
jgi:hypothetical protein